MKPDISFTVFTVLSSRLNPKYSGTYKDVKENINTETVHWFGSERTTYYSLCIGSIWTTDSVPSGDGVYLSL